MDSPFPYILTTLRRLINIYLGNLPDVWSNGFRLDLLGHEEEEREKSLRFPKGEESYKLVIEAPLMTGEGGIVNLSALVITFKDQLVSVEWINSSRPPPAQRPNDTGNCPDFEFCFHYQDSTCKVSIVPCVLTPSPSLHFVPWILKLLGSAQYYKPQETTMAHFQVYELKYISKPPC